MNNCSEHVLYDKVQSVRTPDGKNRDLRITVSETGRPFKKVVLKITDDDDPSVLYNLHVTELDFTSLKAQQGFLVDFSNFAIHLVRLLEQCINNTKGFLVVIEEGPSDTSLKIVQPIDLKNLCYISLRIAPGSETEILHHMKSQILNLKANRESDREECSILQQQVLQLKKEIQEKDYEMRRQERKFLDDQETVKQKAAAEISLLRDHLLMEKKTETDILERKKEALTAQIQELTFELKNTKEKHRKLNEKYEESQRNARELNSCIARLERTDSQMRAEMADLRRRNSELEGLSRKREQELDQCRAQNEIVEKELNKLRSRLSLQDQQLHSTDEEQAKLRSTVAHLQETNKSLNTHLRQVNSDLTKANLIIKDRQKNLEAVHKELQQLAADDQEKQHELTKQALEINLLKKAIEKNEEKLQSFAVKERELSNEVASLKKALSAVEKEHAECDDVMSYLRRSLKKIQLESAAPSPILHTGVIPPPAFASLNQPGVAANKGPFYSTPLGTSGLLTTGKRRSYPGTGTDQTGEKVGNTARKSEEHVPKEALKPTQLVSQKSQKRPERGNSKDRQTGNAFAEKTTVPAKPKEKRQVDGKDGTNKIQNKENKKTAGFKPSSYFQPNRITTDF